MTSFAWKGLDKNGKEASGLIEAITREDAIDRLTVSGIKPYQVEQSKAEQLCKECGTVFLPKNKMAEAAGWAIVGIVALLPMLAFGVEGKINIVLLAVALSCFVGASRRLQRDFSCAVCKAPVTIPAGSPEGIRILRERAAGQSQGADGN